MKISRVYAREIINSKATPTVEVILVLDNGSFVTAGCPSGTSVGTYEAKELRDNDPTHMAGLGVLKAVNNVNSVIGPKLIGLDPTHQHEIDKLMLEIDGTEDKSKLGANAILPVSIAVSKAGAKTLNMPLYAYLKHYTTSANVPIKIPTPMFNLINGGKHAGNTLDFQEFLIIPAISSRFKDGLNMAVATYQALKKILQDKNSSVLIGDEGGFSPELPNNREALVLLSEAISSAGLRLNYEVFLGIDAAANNFYHDKVYKIKDRDSNSTSKELIAIYEGLIAEFNILYLEDPLAEDDWDGWQILNSAMSHNTIIVGDDLTTTNYKRLTNAIQKQAISGIIIKPNQIGTVIESLAVVEAAKHAGLKIAVSHRSGETNDDFIADFAVAVNADYAKLGAPARGERVAKYNRLLEIEASLTVSG
jgi:enolase